MDGKYINSLRSFETLQHSRSPYFKVLLLEYLPRMDISSMTSLDQNVLEVVTETSCELLLCARINNADFVCNRIVSALFWFYGHPSRKTLEMSHLRSGWGQVQVKAIINHPKFSVYPSNYPKHWLSAFLKNCFLKKLFNKTHLKNLLKKKNLLVQMIRFMNDLNDIADSGGIAVTVIASEDGK